MGNKKILKIAVLVLFALLNISVLLAKSASYNLDGFTKTVNSEPIISLDLASNFNTFIMLEDHKDAPYNVDNQVKYAQKRFGDVGFIYSFANPSKAFMLVPFLHGDYATFQNIIFFWGAFLFCVVLTFLFPNYISILLECALPALFLAFSHNSSSLIALSSFTILLLNINKFSLLQGVLCGFLSSNFLVYLIANAILLFRKQYKISLYGLIVAIVLFSLTVSRYGLSSYYGAMIGCYAAIKSGVYIINSLPVLLNKSGLNFIFSFIVYLAFAYWIISYSIKHIFKNENCTKSIQNAFVCFLIPLLLPYTMRADFAYISLATVFLIYDCENRQYLKRDCWFIIVMFLSIYFDGIFIYYFGCSVNIFLAIVGLNICTNRSK